jgi:microcystin-dependent protein
MALPIFQTAIQELSLLQTRWAALLNPLLNASGGSNSGPGLPPATILPFAGPVVPEGFVACDGALLEKSLYPALYQALSQGGQCIYGEQGAFFNVPDYRGYFLRGFDQGAGVDPDGSRSLGSIQSDAFRSHSHNSGVVNSAGTSVDMHGSTGTFQNNLSAFQTGSTGGTETRPVNKAVLYIIKV